MGKFGSAGVYSELTSVADDDELVANDVSDTTTSADGTTKYLQLSTVRTYARANAAQSVTLAAAATTIAVTSAFVIVTGDGGGNTIGTITGGVTGIPYVFLFVDGNVTITDTDAHSANTVDLAGTATNFTSADDTTLTLIYDGTSWYELSRSVN